MSTEQVTETTESNEAATKAAEVTAQEAKQAELKAQMEDILREHGKLTLLPLNKGANPLVKGFRNQLTVLPVALLQNRIESVEEAVQAQMKQVQESLAEQMQYIFTHLGKQAETVRDLSNTLEALAELSNVTEEALEAKIKENEAIREREKEAKDDKTQKRQVVNRAAQIDDTVKINFVGTVDGKEFAGGKGDNYHLKLGSKQFIPGFEDQLVGKSAGDVVDVNVTFPETYGNKDLAGKAATFKTTVVAVKETIKAEAPAAE